MISKIRGEVESRHRVFIICYCSCYKEEKEGEFQDYLYVST